MNDRLDISEVFLKGPENLNQKKKKHKKHVSSRKNFAVLEINKIKIKAIACHKIW